jgi:NADPH-dependent glutamate synthase beta subunit-like oxidoreductase
LEIRKIAKEQGILEGFSQALELIGQEIPFPTSFGYICLHPERAELSPQADHRVVGKKRRAKAASSAVSLRGKVAVIGAGPAGLTAAYELTEKGYPVTVYESSLHAGGMLRKCIPEFRLPKSIVDAEVERIKKIGVEIKTGITVGKDLSFNDLHKEGFRAIFLSVGAHRTRKLGVEGEDLKGVFDALDFLKRANKDGKIDIGERVAVVGGGNVAIDSARTAIRSGAKEVTILYRRSKGEMPANPYEIKEAEHEEVKINYLVAPRRFLGRDGRVTALECVKMALGEPDETGRRAPKPIEGSEFNFPIDSVIVAIGEVPDLSFVPKDLEINEDRTVAVEPFTVVTSLPGVFAGGDCVSGPASVVEAVLAGKKAADCIDEYLRTEKPLKTEQVLEGRKQV